MAEAASAPGHWEGLGEPGARRSATAGAWGRRNPPRGGAQGANPGPGSQAATWGQRGSRDLERGTAPGPALPPDPGAALAGSRRSRRRRATSRPRATALGRGSGLRIAAAGPEERTGCPEPGPGAPWGGRSRGAPRLPPEQGGKTTPVPRALRAGRPGSAGQMVLQEAACGPGDGGHVAGAAGQRPDRDLRGRLNQLAGLQEHQGSLPPGRWGARENCGCIYRLRVRLLDTYENEVVKFSASPNPVLQWTERSCRQVSHVFTNFGKGIRYVSFEQYGRDMRSWVGHYGALVTHSSVRIRIRPS
ncbi:uncharacterized protein LOC101974318 isoform X1 [Ictidomys tridecemlineatus]